MKSLEKNKIHWLEIHLFSITTNKIQYNTSFLLDTSFYRRISSSKIEAAMKSFKKKLNTYTFENNFQKLLVKE